MTTKTNAAASTARKPRRNRESADDYLVPLMLLQGRVCLQRTPEEQSAFRLLEEAIVALIEHRSGNGGVGPDYLADLTIAYDNLTMVCSMMTKGRPDCQLAWERAVGGCDDAFTISVNDGEEWAVKRSIEALLRRNQSV